MSNQSKKIFSTYFVTLLSLLFISFLTGKIDEFIILGTFLGAIFGAFIGTYVGWIGKETFSLLFVLLAGLLFLGRMGLFGIIFGMIIGFIVGVIPQYMGERFSGGWGFVLLLIGAGSLGAILLNYGTIGIVYLLDILGAVDAVQFDRYIFTASVSGLMIGILSGTWTYKIKLEFEMEE